MKTVVILSLLLLAVPAFGQLTKDDLRTIVKEEITASEKRMKEYIDLKVDGVEQSLNARIDGVEKNLNTRIAGVEQSLNTRIDGLDQKIDDVEKNLNVRIDGIDKKFDRVWLVILGLIGLITAAIAVPQLVIAAKERGQKETRQQMERMQAKIDMLENTLSLLKNPPSNPTA